MTESDFWENVNCGNRDECWEWKLHRNVRGYGKTRWASRPGILAHRIAYEIAKAPIPVGMYVLHHCDNPACCNPDHLYVGTQKDNVRDMIVRGRANYARGERHGSVLHPERVARGERSGSRTHPELVPRGDANGMRKHPESVVRGEKSPHAKLTDDQVEDIRNRYATREINQVQLAKEYGVSISLISQIVNYKSRRSSRIAA